MHRSRLTSFLLVAVLLATSVTMTSCGGGAGGTNPDLVLLGFNVPNLSGIPLNQPLIFTFSASINPATITPDSLRVVGVSGPFFESTIVDGNLIGLLPTVPNFADYSDAGLQPDVEYTVSLSTFPATSTIESTSGKPLLAAETFTFRTLPTKSADVVSNIKCNGPDGILGTADDTAPGSPSFFIEARRGIRHGLVPSSGGKSDDEGCLQNSGSGNTLYDSPLVDPTAIQSGSEAGAKLLCLQNEGSPRVIESLSTPRHDQRAVGTPSAVNPGFIDLPAMRVRINEPVDPLTVEPFFAGIPVNVQLWRVALKDGSFTGPDQIATNKPIVVQDTEDTEIILVPASAVPQGIYVVNITPSVKDLPGCPLLTNSQDPKAPPASQGGYDVYEANPAFDVIPPGYKIYFHTLQVPDTPLSVIEDFVNNTKEHGDNQSAGGEFGILTGSVTDAPDLTFDGLPQDPNFAGDLHPEQITTFDGSGDILGRFATQTTTASWNASGAPTPHGPIADVNGYRFLNLPTLEPNTNPTNPGPGRLRAVHQPWCGTGQDGVFDSNGASNSFDTDNGSANGDGVYEFQSFTLRAGDTLTVSGSRPLLILCQGDLVIEGTIDCDGTAGGHGFDMDGSGRYEVEGPDGMLGTDDDFAPASTGGRGGAAGPGGGAGGNGTDAIGIDSALNSANGSDGGAANTIFDSINVPYGTPTPALGGPGTQESAPAANDGSTGGGGGAFASNGGDGATSAGNTASGGIPYGDARFERNLALFQPDRGYQPNANISGGGGGAGGGIEDDDGDSETGDAAAGVGDDGGAGGGGAGGAIWVIAKGLIDVRAGSFINCRGGDGGNTYGPADQLFDTGEDGMPGGGDDFFIGILPSSIGNPGSGHGGPGGGGAGGAVHLIGRAGVNVAGTINVGGGQGGTSDDATRVGGAGSNGRVALLVFDNVASPITVPGTINNAGSSVTGTWFPTIDEASVGQSDWTDLFTANTEFAPMVNGQPAFPTFTGNFTLDATPGNEGFLELPTGQGGGGQIPGFPAGNFDAAFEFQGADFLAPAPDVSLPTTADGLTQWYDVADIKMLDGKRYFRWRWRFWARSDYGTLGGDPANLPLPSVFDLTIPFIKN